MDADEWLHGGGERLSHESHGEERVEDHGQDKVGDEQGHGSVHHGLHGGFAYAHGAVRGVHPLPAGDGGNDEAESKSLDQGYDDVPHGDEFAHEVHPVGLVYVKGGDADDVRGGDAHQNGFHHQDGHGNKHGLYPRLHQVVYRIHIHGFKGIHLFRDFHGADFRGHGGSDAPRKHQPGDDGAQLPEHAHGDDGPAHGFHSHRLKLEKCLGFQHRAGERAGDDDHRLGLHPDFCNLLHKHAHPELAGPHA